MSVWVVTKLCDVPVCYRQYMGDGCKMTRATWEHLDQAGFSKVQLHRIQAPLMFLIKPHIIGHAVK